MSPPLQRMVSRFLALVGFLALPAVYTADPPDQYKTYEIESLQVVEEKPMTAASDQVVVDKDFLNLPRQTSSEPDERLAPGCRSLLLCWIVTRRMRFDFSPRFELVPSRNPTPYPLAEIPTHSAG